MPTIAIIGSGPTAIYTARYLIMHSEESIAITMFESQSQAGKGTPYHQDWNEKEMLANIASIEIPPVTQTLVQWLRKCSNDQLAYMGIQRRKITERIFFPRVALGEYFSAQLAKLVQMAPLYDTALDIKTCHTVEDVKIIDEGIELTVRNGEHIHQNIFDYVVMATGHVWPKETEIRPGYFLSPWPSSSLRTIPDCHVGIRGTSLSAIDAAVALSVARGLFQRDEQGVLHYLPEPGTESFHITMISRKGLLPEADFYHPIPYTPLRICTVEAVDQLITSASRHNLLDAVYGLFKTELAACDSDYAAKLGLQNLTLEDFSHAYFHEREQAKPFTWAALNLQEAKENEKNQYTVPWRYAILRMHEIIARVVPHLLADDHQRFNAHFKHIFVDDYATVPHESIERLLALHEAGKLNIMRAGEDYTLDTQTPERGAIYHHEEVHMAFGAFIEATGQRPLSVHEFPFPSLWQQGLLSKATTPFATVLREQRKRYATIGGIALDLDYHPVSGSLYASKLYCLSLPFMLGQFPFIQGITSSHDMGEKVAIDMIRQLVQKQEVMLATPMVGAQPVTEVL